MDKTKHWSEDSYWTEALEEYHRFRDSGQTELSLNIKAIEDAIYNGDGPAYKIMEAMGSVQELEGYDGFRGAPRLVLALLMRLNEISKGAETEVSDEPETPAMKCPDCGEHIEMEDWMGDEPFGCPHCGVILQLVAEEGDYSGMTDKRLVLCE